MLSDSNLSIWPPLLPALALWALALYLPLSGPLGRMEEAIAIRDLPDGFKQLFLIFSSVVLALGVGVVIAFSLSWSLGPGWAASLGVIAVISGFFWFLASLANYEK